MASPARMMTRSVVYVTYDGVLDPLGSTQVVPYVTGLAATTSMTLVSFEKAARWARADRREAMRGRLSDAGVQWRPLRYHARPRLPATAWDVARGALAITRAARRGPAAIVHCRGEVAMLMARRATLPSGARLLLDRRGFFADERVESGSWAPGSVVDRMVRAAEKANLRRADGLVLLTRAGLDKLASREGPLPPHQVIPTCVDTNAYRPRPAGIVPAYSVVYSGSLGTWYMVEEMVALARALVAAVPGRALFLTPDGGHAVRAGATGGWVDVREADPADVPADIARARASFFLIRPTPAKRASCPTKLGEALACGLPVVANRGIGDVDAILEGEGVGILVDELNETGYTRAAAALARLLSDAEVAARCRRVAEARFALSHGVASYRSLYDEMGPR